MAADGGSEEQPPGRRRRAAPIPIPTGREADRIETLAWRRLALRAIPAIAATWLVLVLIWSNHASVVRITTIAAFLGSAGLAARAAATTVRFRRRWAPDIGAEAPPTWVTLVLVGAAIAATVGWSNVIADADADELTVWPVLLSGAFTGLAGLAAWRHVAGARSLSVELRRSE